LIDRAALSFATPAYDQDLRDPGIFFGIDSFAKHNPLAGVFAQPGQLGFSVFVYQSRLFGLGECPFDRRQVRISTQAIPGDEKTGRRLCPDLLT